jgi:class 3 adenylate cyclase/tetratricopeptide (TPR) repeat protein
MEGERRTVTMLFADIQDSTATAEQLDPEDWAEIINGAFERLIAPIYRYEGTLAQLRGDAVLAFFGAPIAHEDDPVRALRAGLEIVAAMAEYGDMVERRWGVPAHVRVGINTGLVVVGAMGSDLRVEYSALGDAINVAARMEQTADPDTVRVSERTLALTNGLFEAEELGPVVIKGKSDPVPSYQVVRYVGSRHHVDETPIVGRKVEMAELDQLRSRLMGGTGFIASVIGEAGVGKSRLLVELEQRTNDAEAVSHRFDESGSLNWLAGSSRSYDSGHPFSTIGEMFSRWWFSDGSASVFEMIQEAVVAEGVDDPDMAAYLGYISGMSLPDSVADFIGALETQVLNAKANEAAIAYLRAVASRRPTFVVLEDLHWSDDLSLALVENLMGLTETEPLGLVIVMRPYREEPPWRIHEVAERDHHHRYLNLSLAPLDLAESTALLESLLADQDLSPEARQGILARSEGNPFYIEQMVRSLQELDADQLHEGVVPSSLTGLLTARLDRLEEQTRYFVQMASVIGSEFDRATLAALVDTPSFDTEVTDLLRRGILIETPGRPGSLSFRHALIQEVAYETILRRTRRELHRRVADYLVASGGESQEIARHLVTSGDLNEAYPFLIDAGVRATRSMALADAIDLLTTAVANTPDDAVPELIMQAHDTLGEAYSLIPDLSQAAASYQRMFEFGESNERPQAQVTALNRLAYATASLGADLDGAAAYLTDARRIAEESHDEIGLAEYHMNACFVASMAGDVSVALAHDEETVRLGKKSGVESIRLMGMVRRAANYISLLDFEHGLPAIDDTLKEATESGLEEARATVELMGLATAKLLLGEIHEALDTAERSQVTLERYGSFYLALCSRTLAECHYELGNVEDSLARYVDVKRVAASLSQPFTAATGSSGMALVYATAGISDEIPALRSEVEESLSGQLGEFLASTALADLGFTSLLLGETRGAETDFTRGLSVSSTTQFIERPGLLVGRALARLGIGDVDGAEDDLVNATAIVEEKRLGLYASRVGLARGRILASKGDLAGAGDALAEAQEHAMTVGQRLTLVQVLGERARLVVAGGDQKEAESHVEAARGVVEAIADGIADEVLRNSFRDKWLGEIAQLRSQPVTLEAESNGN